MYAALLWYNSRVRVELPKPPSVNQMYKYTAKGGFARSYVSPEGVKWFATAGQILHNSIKLTAPITVKMQLQVHLFTTREQDVDNIGKATLDLLQKCILCSKNACLHKLRVLENDSLIYDFRVRKWKVKHRDEEKIILLLEPLEYLENPFLKEQSIQYPESVVREEVFYQS